MTLDSGRAAQESRGPERVGTLLLVFLLVLPARLVFAPLGGAGSPAQIAGCLIFAWWCLARLASLGRGRPLDLISLAVLGFLASVAASYVAASITPRSALESSAADRGVISAVGFCGMALLFSDMFTHRDHVIRFLGRFTTLAGALGLFGAVQFATGQTFVEYIAIPGLTANSDVSGLDPRGSFLRPTATLVHPIELGSVLTMALPLALHLGFNGPRVWSPARRWWPLLGIAIGIPLCLSRSALISAVVALIILVPTWPRNRRRLFYGAAAAWVAVLYVGVPGLVGTIRGMFTTLSDDPSVDSRASSYGLALQFIERSPLFGRGFRTFLPQYRILDNQYLLAIIETGVIGLVLFLALFGSAIWVLARVRSRTRDSDSRSLAVALTASIAAAAVSFLLFDAFSFAAAAGCLFCLVGAAGALHRLSGPTDLSAEPASEIDLTRHTSN